MANIFRLLDLTSLNDADAPDTIRHLVSRSRIRVHGEWYAVAAVCIYPQFIAVAKEMLDPSVELVTVINFPHGTMDTEEVVEQARRAIDQGATELDVVFPRHAPDTAPAMLSRVKELCGTIIPLKVILETAALSPEQIVAYGRVAIQHGADFLKTSTGKLDASLYGVTGATTEAVACLLEARALEHATHVGIKVSGGVQTLDQANQFYAQVQAAFHPDQPLSRQEFRIGASGLYNACLSSL
jgi:deoxyribose-phosphate aldolase